MKYHTSVTKPWKVINMDILDPLSIFKNGFQYILIFTEYFNKWIKTFFLFKIDSRTIAKCLIEEIICRYGVLKKILFDRGIQLIEKVVKKIIKLMNIKQMTTTAYYLQTNEITERYNKMLTAMFKVTLKGLKLVYSLCVIYISYCYTSNYWLHFILFDVLQEG